MNRYIFAVCLLLASSALVNGECWKWSWGQKKVQQQLEHDPISTPHDDPIEPSAIVKLDDGERNNRYQQEKFILQKIYQMKPCEAVDPEQVMEWLKQLRELDKYPNKMFKMFLELPERDAQKCNPDYMTDLQYRFATVSYYECTLKPYTEHNFPKYLSFCVEGIRKANVSGITEEHLEKLGKLYYFIIVMKSIHFSFKLKAITEYLEDKRRVKHLEIDGFPKFLELFESEVEDPCRAWIKATDSARPEGHVIDKYEFKTRWAEYRIMCYEIMSHRGALVEKLSDYYRDSQNFRKESRVPKRMKEDRAKESE